MVGEAADTASPRGDLGVLSEEAHLVTDLHHQQQPGVPGFQIDHLRSQEDPSCKLPIMAPETSTYLLLQRGVLGPGSLDGQRPLRVANHCARLIVPRPVPSWNLYRMINSSSSRIHGRSWTWSISLDARGLGRGAFDFGLSGEVNDRIIDLALGVVTIFL